LVDSRALLASTAPPPPPPKSAAQVAADEQRAALLSLEAQRKAEQEAKNRKREETNTDDAAVSEAFGGGSSTAVAKKEAKFSKPTLTPAHRSGVVKSREAWKHDGKLIGAKPAARVKSGGLGGYDYTPAWGEANSSSSSNSSSTSSSSSIDIELKAQPAHVQRRNLLMRNRSDTFISRRVKSLLDHQRRLQTVNPGGYNRATRISTSTGSAGHGAGVRSGVYAAASKRAASTAQLRGATSAGQQAAAALAANRKAAAEWAAAQPGYQPPKVAPWLKEAKHRLDKGGGPPPPIGAARGGGYDIRTAGGGGGFVSGGGSRGVGRGNTGYHGANHGRNPNFNGKQAYQQNSKFGSSSSSGYGQTYEGGGGGSRLDIGVNDASEIPLSAEAAAREERKAAFLEAHTRRRHAEKHRSEVLAAEAASGGDNGDGRLSPRAAANGAPGALHWQAMAAAGGGLGRAQVVVVAAADYAWRGLALNWCLGLERVSR